MQSANLTLRLPPSMKLPAPSGAIESFRREEVLSWEIDRRTETIRFLSLVVGDPEALDGLAADLDLVNRYDVTPIDEETCYGYVEMDLRAADASLMGAFDVPGLVIVPPMVYTGREQIHVTVLGKPDAMYRCSIGSPRASVSRSNGSANTSADRSASPADSPPGSSRHSRWLTNVATLTSPERARWRQSPTNSTARKVRHRRCSDRPRRNWSMQRYSGDRRRRRRPGRVLIDTDRRGHATTVPS